ncbi:MAG TPA: hypothetical protein DCQ50_16250 [Chryseobacterium sp.]|nr:hypothetical protein [Chryseobacterium sp.]
MDTQLIYILDEKIPSSQLKEQLEKTTPLTKEEVVDLILSKIDYQDEAAFDLFVKKYNRVSFTESSNQVKYNTYLDDVSNLESENENLGTWYDPEELRSDLMANLISFNTVEDKTVLFNYQIQNWISKANDWRLLCKKREYLKNELIDIKTLLQMSIYYGQAVQNDLLLQFVPEKWYALLHIILINLGKKDPIADLKDKNGIMKLGKDHYRFQGTGQVFQREIKNIMTSKPAVYISNLSTKDRKILKPLILLLSGNDADVANYLKKLPN